MRIMRTSGQYIIKNELEVARGDPLGSLGLPNAWEASRRGREPDGNGTALAS